MKKLFFVAALLLAPNFSFAAERDDFVDALKNTLDADVFAATEYSGSVAADAKTIFSADGAVRAAHKKSGDLTATEKFTANFDFNFPDFPKISGKISGKDFVDFNAEKNKFSFGFFDLVGDFSGPDAEKAAGFLEMAKIAADKKWIVSFENQPEISKFLKNYASFAPDFFGLLIDAGLFQISETPEGFRLVFNRDTKQWKPEVLAILLEKIGAPRAAIVELRTTDRKHFSKETAKMVKNINFSIEVGVENAKITSIAMNFSLHFDYKIYKWNYETFERFVEKTIPIAIRLSGKTDFSKKNISLFEISKMPEISIDKILKLFDRPQIIEIPEEKPVPLPSRKISLPSGKSYRNHFPKRAFHPQKKPKISLPSGKRQNRHLPTFRY